MVRILIALLCFWTVVTVPASAYQLDRSVIGRGGGQVSNGAFVLSLTIGEPIIGLVGQSGICLGLGYWGACPLQVVAVQDSLPGPLISALGSPQPNPFSLRSVVDYTIGGTQPISVRLGVYDVAGRLVRTLVSSTQAPSRYSVTWDGRGDDGRRVAGGLYFLRLNAGPTFEARKIVVLG